MSDEQGLTSHEGLAGGDEEDTKLESKVTQTFLNLEQIDPLLYRSTHLFKPLLGRAVYGGLVVGQALVAASNTAPADRHVHSLHCYFLRGGSIDQPILYHVQEIRDGKTYSNRFVNATQLGKSIFTMMVSFKTPEEDEFSHQFKMPDVPPPEECAEIRDLLRDRLGMDIGEKERDYINNRLSEEFTILRKPVDPNKYFAEKAYPAQQFVWLKVKGHIGPNQQMQNCAAAYISDSMLIGTAQLPSERNFRNSRFFMTSLDHALWFHHPIKADEWNLFEMESPQCGSGRCMCLGRTWSRHGLLTMSVSQEGLIRSRPPKPRESTSTGSSLVPGRKTHHVSSPGRSVADIEETKAKSSVVIHSNSQGVGFGSTKLRRLFQAACKSVRIVH